MRLVQKQKPSAKIALVLAVVAALAGVYIVYASLASTITVNIYNTYKTGSTAVYDQIFADGQTVSGGLTLRAAPTSTSGISKVEFFIDNPNPAAGAVPFKTETTAPYCLGGKGVGTGYCYLWNSRSVSNGPHSVTAVAYDSGGVISPAKTVSFTVNNIDTTNPKWEPLYRDDFNTLNTGDNPTKWSLYNSPGHAGYGLRRPSAITVSGGNLVITANNQDVEGAGTKVVSGGMSNRMQSVYGKYEVRVKTDADPSGIMSGVILTWPANAYDNMIWGENDFYETGHPVNTRTPFKSFIHWPNTFRNEPYKQTSFQHDSDGTQWHKVIMEWTAEYVSIKTFKDPDPATTSDDVPVSNKTMYETDNLREEIPDNDHRVTIQLDAFSHSLLQQPVRMYVDYLQVHKLVPGSSTSDTISPTTPTSVVAAAASSSQINLSWAASTDTGGSGLRGYNIYRNNATTPLNGGTPVSGTSFNSTGLAASTTYTYQIEAVDGAGNKSAKAGPVSATTPAGPPMPPVALKLINADTDQVILTMVNGMTIDLKNARNLNVDASAGVALQSVRFDYDGQVGYKTENDAPYAIAGDNGTTDYYAWTPAVGTHTLTAKAFSADAAGGTELASSSISFTVVDSTTSGPDIIPPGVSMFSPANGATVSGIITAEARASDPPSQLNGTGINRVEFFVDDREALGTPRIIEDAIPYTYSLDTKTLSNGTHYITAKAYDAAGNSSVATSTVTVSNLDTVAPNPPASLSGVTTQPTSTTASNVSLTWPAASDNSGGSGVKGYYVYRNGMVISTLIPHTAAASYGYADGGVPAGNQAYTVRSVDNANLTSSTASPAYNTAITPPIDTVSPTAPSNVAASAVSATQINVSWLSATDTGGSGLAGYNIYRGTSATTITTKLNTNLVTTTSFGDGNLFAETTYYYQVEAVDGAGNKTKSSSVTATTLPGSTLTSVVLEGEIMAAPSGANSVSDSSASGSRALWFYSNSTATGLVSLSSAASQLIVRAKADQCNGSPRMIVKINGVEVLNSLVAATSWTDYPAAINVAGGNHSVSIAFNNDFTKYAGKSDNQKCSRDLYVDKITLSGGD